MSVSEKHKFISKESNAKSLCFNLVGALLILIILLGVFVGANSFEELLEVISESTFVNDFNYDAREEILSIDAVHLDSNYNEISNIYEETKSLDNIWSEKIYSKEYVRVIFERNLTSKNDITVYARGNASLEVYEKDSNILIADFGLIEEGKNKVFLSDLQGSQNTFDLRVVGDNENYLEFDYITDPIWFNTSWRFRVNITIQSSQITSTLTNFTVYVNLSDLGSDFFSNSTTDCGDLRVTESDFVTEVAREVVFCDTGAETGELHFITSSLSASTDTTFWIYYNNSGATEPPPNSTFGSQNAWDIKYNLHKIKNKNQPSSLLPTLSAFLVRFALAGGAALSS